VGSNDTLSEIFFGETKALDFLPQGSGTGVFVPYKHFQSSLKLKYKVSNDTL